MKETLKQAIIITNSKIAFIPFLALIGITTFDTTNITLFTGSIILLGFILDIILYSIVYGRCIENVTKSPESSWQNILSIYWVDYFLAGLAILPLGLILVAFLPKQVAGLIVGCLTIYVYPLIFLRHNVLSSIYLAIKFVFHKFIVSSSLIILIVLKYAIMYVALHSAVAIKVSSGSSLAIYGVLYIQNLFITYIHLTIFTAATIILIEHKLWVDTSDTQEKEMVSNNLMHSNADQR